MTVITQENIPQNPDKEREKDPSVGAGITPSGNVGVNITQQTSNDGDSISAGIDSSGNVGGGAYASGSDGTIGISAGYNISTGNVGVTPYIQIGSGEGAQQGAQIGSTAGSVIGAAVAGPVGAAIGAAIGSAAGSVIGGGTAGNEAVQMEGKKRDTLRDAYRQAGLVQDEPLLLPDGTTLDISSDHDDRGQREWYDSSRRVDELGEDRKLHDYETDYTNDLDYFAGMGGLTLSRLVSGGSDDEKMQKGIDQLGNQIGNQSLGSVGYGATFTEDNFKTVTANQRAIYAQAGINSKEDLLTLANQAYADGRLDDADYVVAQQTAKMIFDDDYATASTLMAGRWEGTKAAANEGAQGKAQGQLPRAEPGRIRGSGLSIEEARMSIAPLMEYYDANRPKMGPSRAEKVTADVASGLSMAASAYGAYQSIDRYSGGAISDYISGLFTTSSSTQAPSQPTLISATATGSDTVGGIDMGVNS